MRHWEITICDVLAIWMPAFGRKGSTNLNGYYTVNDTVHPGAFTEPPAGQEYTGAGTKILLAMVAPWERLCT